MYTILYCAVLLYTKLHYSVLYYTSETCTVQHYITVLYYITVYCSIPCYTLLYYSIFFLLHHTIFYYAIPNWAGLGYTILRYTTLHYHKVSLIQLHGKWRILIQSFATFLKGMYRNLKYVTFTAHPSSESRNTFTDENSPQSQELLKPTWVRRRTKFWE